MARDSDLRYLEEKIAGLRDLIDARFEQVEAHFESMDKAVQLQAKEYERRLDDLNNEGSRLAAAVAANVSNDTWVGFQQRFDEWQESVNNTLAQGATAISAEAGRAQGISSTFAVITTVITVGLPIVALVIYLTVR